MISTPIQSSEFQDSDESEAEPEEGSQRVNRLALLLATWFGCGYFPFGPGTMGSLAAVLIAAALHVWLGEGRLVILLLTLVLLFPGIWASTRTARLLGKKDPGMVVIDEVLGQWVTLLGLLF